MLQGMAKHAQEMSPIMAGDKGDPKVARRPTNCDDDQEASLGVISGASRCEKHARRRRHRNRCRRDQGPGGPMREYFQEFRQSAFLEFPVEIGRSGSACEPKRKSCAQHRSRSRRCRIFIPQRTVAGRQNRSDNVRPSECGQRGTVENRQKEKTGRAQMAKRCDQILARAPFGSRGEQVPHLGNISTSPRGGSFAKLSLGGESHPIF